VNASTIQFGIIYFPLLSKNTKLKIYKTIILPVVLCGCKIWTVTAREEHRLRESENRVLSRIFRSKKEAVTGGWRRLHNEELCNLYLKKYDSEMTRLLVYENSKQLY
jgi:hypothetical protein